MEEPKRDEPEAIDPLEMEDSLRHSLPDNRFMGIRHHHVMRRPEELISFRQLLMRWRHNSFYIVSFCAGLVEAAKDEHGKHPYAMRLRIAKRIAARTAAPDTGDGKKKDPKNRHELVVTLANCKQDRTLRTFPLFCNYFNLLYFDIADVEAMEKRFPEILLTDPKIQNLDPLYTTTEANIDQVAPLALYYWHCIDGSFDTVVSYIDDSPKGMSNDNWLNKDQVRKATVWKLNDGIHYPEKQWKKYMKMPAEKITPTLSYQMPLKFKRSRKNDLQEFKPLVDQLQNEGMVIYDERICAKIIYSLFPQLSHGESGALFPASPNVITSKQTDRDRGRWLLGLK